MRNAKSAKAAIALGATLFAMSVQVLAADVNGKVVSLGSSKSLGIDAGGAFGIDAGGLHGIDAGGVFGIDAGGLHGIDAGGVFGIDAGGLHGIDAGGVFGIDAGGLRGIDAGGAFGIDAGGLHGIDAGGAFGIDAGGLRGIDAGGAFGIDAGGLRGIDAGGAFGIDAGGLHGIDAGGAFGIDAGGLHGIDAGGAFGIDAGGLHGIDAGGMLLAGPVSSIDRRNGVFESLGQIVMASQPMLANMKVGDFVSVSGSVVAAGWLYADDVSVSSESYVPGSTRVFVSGVLGPVDTRNGIAKIGSLSVDYTPSLSSATVPSGALWSFSGIVPERNGLMISEGSRTR